MTKRQAMWVASSASWLVRCLQSEYDSRDDGYEICKNILEQVDKITFDLDDRLS